MGRVLRKRDADWLPDDRLDRHPIDGGARALVRHDAAAIDSEPDRHFPCGHQLREQRVARAHVGLHRGEPVEEFHPAILTPEFDDSREPDDIARLDAELPFPFRIEEPLVGLWQVLLAHELRVVGHTEIGQAVRKPRAVRRDRHRSQVGEMGAVELREDLLAGHSFEVRPDRFDGVDAEAPGPRLADRALRDLFARRAP